MAGELTIDERVVASDYERVARDAEARAEKLSWAADALRALLDPGLSQEARDEVYGLILAKHDDDDAVKLDRPSELRVEQNLGRAGDHVFSLVESAQRSAVDAEEMSESVERYGLPGSEE